MVSIRVTYRALSGYWALKLDNSVPTTYSGLFCIFLARTKPPIYIVRDTFMLQLDISSEHFCL